MLDGIVTAGDSLLVSSWKSSAIYRGKVRGIRGVVSNVKAPADIGSTRTLARVRALFWTRGRSVDVK